MSLGMVFVVTAGWHHHSIVTTLVEAARWALAECAGAGLTVSDRLRDELGKAFVKL